MECNEWLIAADEGFSSTIWLTSWNILKSVHCCQLLELIIVLIDIKKRSFGNEQKVNLLKNKVIHSNGFYFGVTSNSIFGIDPNSIET